jgi:hypothetical protein
VKTHYSDPLYGTFRYSIIIHIIQLFEKYSTFHFGYRFNIIMNFIIYIEGSMRIFIIYIGITRPLFRFDSTNFNVSFFNKIINFNEFLKMSHLAIFFIFHVNVITCQKFNLLYIYCIFAEKTHFFK